MRDVERVEDLRLGNLVGTRLDHQDGLFGAGHDEVEVRALLGVREQVLLFGIDDEVAVDLADAHGSDRRREGDVGEHDGRRGAIHGQDVVRMDVVDGQRDRDQLRVVAPVLRKQRPQRAVDHARGQGRLLPRPALALEERPRDFPRGVHSLLHVDRERQEIDIAHGSGDRGGEHHRVALAHHHCA